MDLFPSNQTLYRRLAKLRRSGEIHIVGYTGSSGRPRDVYSIRRKWKADRLEHDLALTRILNKWNIDSEMSESDPFPDAVIGQLYVEYDTGTIPLTRVETHMRKYEDCDNPVVFITRSENRLINALDRFLFLEGRVMACTDEKAMREPSDVILRHTDGDTILLDELLSMVLEKV